MPALVALVIVVGIIVIIVSPVAWSFFQNVGVNWLSDANAPGADQQMFPSPEQSPAIANIFEQMAHGWQFSTILHIWGPWFTISLFLSLLMAVGITYCVVRILQIRRIERASVHKAAHPIASKDLPRTQLRWNHIQDEGFSDDPQKWRLAILESDILLNELLDVLGYKGETMAEKMKKVDIAAFNTIDFAWEAHKIRNKITQEGAAFALDAREAKRVIRMYERVFREFKYIE